MLITRTPRFLKAYAKLTADVRDATDEALSRFVVNPRHPGLHFEKLIGSQYRTIRVDRGRWRIVIRDLGRSHYELVDVDRHQSIDRNYG